MNADQLNAFDRFQLGDVSLRQETAFESHFGGFANPQLGLADRPDFTTQSDFAHDERRKIDRTLPQTRRDGGDNAQINGRFVDVDPDEPLLEV